MASKVTFMTVAALAVATFFFPVSGCAHAYADEFIVSDDYATRSDVSRLDGSVSALTGSVSSGLSVMQDDVSSIGRDVAQLVEGGQVEQQDIKDAKDSSQKAAEGVQAVSDDLDAQGKKLDDISADLRTLTESNGDSSNDEVSQLTIAELLALVPDDASEQVVEYMQYPFIMGMASGVFGYVVSLVIAAVYRLLGFK